MHSHQQIGDPAAAMEVEQVVQRLRDALRSGGEEASTRAIREVESMISTVVHDGNPRTRAQGRALRTVVELARSGRAAEAAELAEGELWRSFPGRGDLNAAQHQDVPATGESGQTLST